MKKKCVFLILFLLFHFTLDVFAEGLPTNSFTSNSSNSMAYNYIRLSLRSRSMTSPFIYSFDVPYNLKTNDGKYPLYIFSKNLGVPSISEEFIPSNDNPTEVMDSGILYILTYGYNTGNSNESIFMNGEHSNNLSDATKQYITQIALWLYIYQNKEQFKDTYCFNDACVFLDSSNQVVPFDEVYNLVKEAGKISDYSYLSYIIDLVDNAKVYKKEVSQLSSTSAEHLSYQVKKESNQLISEVLRPIANSNSTNFLNYTVTIEDPNQYGAYFIHENGQRIDDLSSINGSFQLVVPLKEKLEDMDLSSIKIKITGYFLRSDAYEYHVSRTQNADLNSFSSVLYGFIPTETVENVYTLQNFVRISALSPNKSILAGATMVLTKKGDSNYRETWISGEDVHFIQLREGDYTLCETNAPKGYETATQCYDFSVNGANVNVEIPNVEATQEQAVVVPDTALFQSPIIRFIGVFLLMIGVSTLGFIFLKNEK